MGKKRDSQMNVSFGIGWLRKKMSMEVKIFLGALLALCAMVMMILSYNGILRKNWHLFAASEAVHLIGIIVLIYKLFTKKNCSGLSLKTQELTAIIQALKLIHRSLVFYSIFTVIDLISPLSTLLAVWMIKFKLKSSYIKEFDNMRISFLVVPCAVLATIIHPYTSPLVTVRIISAFCVYLEAVVVLPQIRFMQNAKMVETFTGYYVFALGVSRLLSLARWIIQIYIAGGVYQIWFRSSRFWIFAAFLSEIVRSFILADFVYYYIKSFKQGQLLRKIPI